MGGGRERDRPFRQQPHFLAFFGSDIFSNSKPSIEDVRLALKYSNVFFRARFRFAFERCITKGSHVCISLLVPI